MAPMSVSDYGTSGSDRSRFSYNNNPPSSRSSSSGSLNNNTSHISSDVDAAYRRTHHSLSCTTKEFDAIKRSKHSVPCPVQPALKRMRSEYGDAELNFLAANAKALIEQGGFVYPTVNTSRPRIFPLQSDVDMSTVTHKYSSEYTSPFLADGKNTSATYLGCPHEMTSLLQSTSSYYRLEPENEVIPASLRKVIEAIRPCNSTKRMTPLDNCYVEGPSSDSDSWTSSVTVSDNDPLDSNPSDGNMTNSQHVLSTGVSTMKPQSNMGNVIVPIGEALAISRRPRVIVLAQAPYTIVQVNAAFLRQSKSKLTSDFPGKSLNDFMQLETDGSTMSLTSGLRSSYKTKQKVSLTVSRAALRFNSGGSAALSRNNDVYRVSIVPVGTVEAGQNLSDAKITHFAIKFSIPPPPQRSRPLSSPSTLSSGTATSSTGSKTGAINVMG
jgi:hypothetical protein